MTTLVLRLLALCFTHGKTKDKTMAMEMVALYDNEH